MKQYTYELIQDSDPLNPRTEYDNLGTMTFNDNRYISGDKDALSIEVINDLVEEGKCIMVPVYAYIHSGITIRTTPFSCMFDSGLLGYCYVTREKLRDEALQDRSEEEIQKYLTNEVKTFDQYLNNDVWGYVIKDHHDAEIESCWGFFGEDYCKQEAENIITYLLKPKTLELY